MFDIMGMTDRLKAVGNPLDEGYESIGWDERWRHAATPVVSLQANLGRALAGLSRVGSEFVGMDKRLVWQAFADSVVVSVPYANRPARFSDTLGLLLTCGATVPAALIAQVPLQCAFELGLATDDLLPGQVYGPALVEAHELLTGQARFPRIVVGQRLLGVLRDAASRRIPDAGEDAERWASAASKTLGILTEDEAGQMFVDYLGRGFAEALGEPVATRAELQRVCQWARREEDRLRQRSDFRAAYKYAEVLRYFAAQGYRE